MKITVKTWIYKKAQESTGYGRTLVWDDAKEWKGERNKQEVLAGIKEGNEADIEYFFDDANWEQAYHLYGTVAKVTEKAVMLECKYWDWRYVRYVNDAPVKEGWRVWIPKSAIYNLEEVV